MFSILLQAFTQLVSSINIAVPSTYEYILSCAGFKLHNVTIYTYIMYNIIDNTSYLQNLDTSLVITIGHRLV